MNAGRMTNKAQNNADLHTSGNVPRDHRTHYRITEETEKGSLATLTALTNFFTSTQARAHYTLCSSERQGPMESAYSHGRRTVRARCGSYRQEPASPTPPVSYPWVWLTFQQAASKAGIGKLGTHSLRHSCHSWLDAVGAPIAVQQKLMRRSDIRTTLNIYGDVVTDEMAQAHSKVVGLPLPRKVIAN